MRSPSGPAGGGIVNEMPATTTDRPRPLFARFYAAVSPRMEDVGIGPLRDELLAGLQGRVVEVGAGNGLNFRHYPATVTQVLAVEPEPHLRGLAEQAAARARVAVTVEAGRADALPLTGGQRRRGRGVAGAVLAGRVASRPAGAVAGDPPRW